jgi:hypothetical protein
MIRRNRPVALRQILPDTRVPLSDESAPVLDVEIYRSFSNTKRGSLVSIGRRGQDIDAVKAASGQRNCLAFGDDCIERGRFCGCQIESDTVIVDMVGQHFGGQRVAVTVETAAHCLGVIIGGNCKVVVQTYRLRLD